MDRPYLSRNGSSGQGAIGNEISLFLKEMLKGGLSLLWRGSEYARDLDRENYEFAVEATALHEAGFSEIDIRWLVARGYVQLVSRVVPDHSVTDTSRRDQCVDSQTAAYILTKMGATLAYQILSQSNQVESDLTAANGNGHPTRFLPTHSLINASIRHQKPNWDQNRKELRVGQCVIKLFRWVAINQETVLMAFEEEGWPARIDDPLPQKLNQDSKTRLHDTIKCLNRNHQTRLIRFTGDGTGEGILWGFLEDAELDS